MEPRQQLVFYQNQQSFETVLKLDRNAVCMEMKRRLSDPTAPLPVRFMEAAVLVVEKDEAGQNFFEAQGQAKDPESIRDLYWLIFNLWLRGQGPGLPKTDLAWAEDLMLDAIQDKTQLNRDKVYHPLNMEPTVEVREIALRDGKFATILGDLKCQRAVPVLMAALGDKAAPAISWSSTEIIDSLGDFGDRSVEPVLLNILKQHDDTYRFAVHAASQLGLKSAVPILLQHLDDPYSYGWLEGNGLGGLKVLADASNLPALNAALAFQMDGYARAEDELLIIQLQNQDVVGQLCALWRDASFPCRTDVYLWLARLKSDDAVPALTEAMCHDKEDYVRRDSIQVLAATRTKKALEALVVGLWADYSDVHGFKVMPNTDFNVQFRGQIANALKEITRQDFGTDAPRWKQWLDSHNFN